MAKILNNIKIWWLEKRLKSHETKRNFLSNFLPIKSGNLEETFNNKIDILALKEKNEL